MKIVAEFMEEDAAIEGHQAIVDAGVPPASIDVRSAYPLPETALPPHRSHPMLIRNWVRLFWVCGATLGFSFISFTQLIWPIHTGGHPLVPLPIDFILTYECGMITGLIMTVTFLYLETRRYRNLNPPLEEDRPVEIGNIAIVVDGPGAEKAEGILKARGALSVVRIAAILLVCLPLINGCAVKMRDQDYIKSTQTSAVPQAQGTLSMPTAKEQKLPIVKPLGYFYPPEMRKLDKGMLTVPPAYMKLKNPVPADAASEARGKLVFEHNCIFCHGPQAEGNGPVGQVYLPTPANLRDPAVKAEPDGALFYKITMGPATMPSFANRLSTQDRFDVINYIRYLEKR